LFKHCVFAAAARTFWTAGTRRAIRIAMMAMTNQQLDQGEALSSAQRERFMEFRK